MITKQQTTIAVLGAGSWGTALACLLARHNLPIVLWDHESRHITALKTKRVNERYLPGIPLPENLQVAESLEEALASADEVLIVVPSHAFRTALERAAGYLKPQAGVAWATKGLEPDSGKLLHVVAAEVLGGDRRIAVMSGPTFAREVAEGLPTAITVASDDPDFAEQWAARLHGMTMRAYTSNDMTGVGLGGAVKNVLAIATGIADGLGFGANTRAALVTRGLAEMMRLGIALGGQRDTFMGLAGLGDLVLTCTDDQSRNRRLGMALGRGEPLEEALSAIGQVVEGVRTAREVRQVAKSHNIDMPITEQVYQILYAGRTPRDAGAGLLGRDLKPETL